MSRIYQYGYKLVPLYFFGVGMLCVVLYWLSYPFFDYAMLSSYLSNSPQYFSFYTNEYYSILNLFAGFLLIFIIGVHSALIVGCGLSIYWSEFMQSSIREKGLNFLEVLVNIPFVVFGYILLIAISKLIDLQQVSVFQNMLIISLIIGGMILPELIYKLISILQSIPYNQREGAYSLGASRYRTAIMVLIPSQLKLFIATIINIVARAFAEILIIILLAGFTEEVIEVIISIIFIAIISTIVSQWLKKSNKKDGTI